MKKGMRRTLTALVLGIFFAGCTTIPGERDGMEFTEMINAGEWEVLSEGTAEPFLLDTEMIMRRSDMREFWKILAERNFSLGETELLVIDEPAEAARYGRGLEIEQFFAKYVPEKSATFLAESTAGRFYMTIGRDEKRNRMIYAFAGPLGKEE